MVQDFQASVCTHTPGPCPIFLFCAHQGVEVESSFIVALNVQPPVIVLLYVLSVNCAGDFA